ncbi:MAG: hypothetical protein JEZ11_13180 [Desulfobacterales bacterium]|nr:hypothetical protein [Desulfobacterales bacterium]
MARHFTWTDMLYGEGIESVKVDASEISAVATFTRPMKKIKVRNEGPSDVFLAFDKTTADANDFKLLPGDGLIDLPIQCESVAVVCASGDPDETAAVRISGCF